jgi:acyl dehydratase
MAEEERFLSTPTLTDDALRDLRNRIGTPITTAHPQPYVTRASADAIRHWCYGIGDYNPLYLDEEYALAGPYQGLTAPPSFLYAFDKRVTGGVMGLPGITGMFAGVRWEWYRPVREDDAIRIESAVLKDVIEREGKFAGRQFQVISEIKLVDADGNLVATSCPYGFRMGRKEAGGSAKYQSHQPYHYSPQELDQIWDIVEAEWRRGSAPFTADSLRVGDELGPIIRGPLTTSDIIVFLMGWGGQYLRSHGDWIAWARRHPDGILRNSIGVPDCIEAVHWDQELAHKVGVPAAYDYGPQRVAWATTLVTNWMGDAARLAWLELSLRRHVLIGDAIWISGTVRQITTDGGETAVDLDLSMRNQQDEMVAAGSAHVVL